MVLRPPEGNRVKPWVVESGRLRQAKKRQNLENKMELQINSLETRIEKMQEMYNKDIEEIKRVNNE